MIDENRLSARPSALTRNVGRHAIDGTQSTAVIVAEDVRPALDRLTRGSGLAHVVLAPPAMESSAPSHDRPPTANSSIASSQRVQAIESGAQDDTRYAASCAAALLDQLLAACEERDVQIGSITTADHAWAEAARVTLGPHEGVVAVELTDAEELRLVATSDGRVEAWRRLPIDAPPGAVRQALESLVSSGNAGRLLALGSPDFRARLADAVHPLGWDLVDDHPRISELDHDPLAVAAAFGGTGPRFVPPTIIAREKARTRRKGLLAAAAAVVLLLFAGVADLLDLRSEMNALRAARASISDEVSSSMDAQSNAATLAESAAELRSLRSATPRWTAILAALADGLPRDAQLRSLRAQRDSLYLELEAADVAGAVDALGDVSWWTSLRSVGAVETEVGEEGAITERLTIGARVRWQPLNDTRGQRQ